MLPFSYRAVIVYALMTFLAICFHENICGLLLTIPQIIVVLYCIIKKRFTDAFIYHIVFSLTCVAIPFSSLTSPGESYALFNYAKLKIVGPISISLLLSILIFLSLSLAKYKLICQNSLFLSLSRVLFFFAIYGIAVGCVGLACYEYNLDAFITFSVYIIPILVNICILLALDSVDFKKKLFTTLVELLTASPIASVMCLMFGVFTLYSDDLIIPQNEVGYYSVLLIFSVFYMKRFWLPFCAALISIGLMKYGGSGGKGIITSLIVLVFFIVFLFKNGVGLYKSRIYIIKYTFSVFLIIFGYSFLHFWMENELFMWKLFNVFSLFEIFNGMDGIDLIPNSPRIRIVSFLNILHPILENPIVVIMGAGYGGSFTDSLNAFAHSDLSHAFSNYEISIGKYARPHDTYAAVPLVNGLLGLFLLIRISIKYLCKYRDNFMTLSVIPWLLLTFYYNSQFAIVAVLLLYVSSLSLTSNILHSK